MKVSVCIPVYNPHPGHLFEALQSIRAQRGVEAIEVVVSDDASRAPWMHVLDEFEDLDIRRFANRTNLGMVGNWNAAVERSSGDLVVNLGQDDVLSSEQLIHMSAVFREPEVVICGCARRFIDDQGRAFRPLRWVNDRSNVFVERDSYRLDAETLTRLSLRNGNVLGEPSAVMFRRRVFDVIGGYDPLFRHAADVDFNLRAVERGVAAYLPRTVVGRRLHANNLTRENIASGVALEEPRFLVERFGPRLSPRELQRVSARLCIRALYHGVRAVAKGSPALAARALRSATEDLRLLPGPLLSDGWEIISGRNRWSY